MNSVEQYLVEQYLSDMGAIRATGAGTVETSYYTALSTLLNEIGKKPTPKVRCVIQLQNKGAGMPDGGMFTADQFKSKTAKQEAGANPLKNLPPSRGVIEVKSPAEDMAGIIVSEQIARYWDHYGLVLVTNYRAFTLIGRTVSGQAVELESFTLAATEADFWKLAAHPRTCPDALRERFAEYLYRAMTHNAPLASPQDVAAVLASYARDAKARIEHADLPALAGLREALEHALGLKFEGEKGEHFFRSTLIQTLFYGIFSAWVLWARKRKPATAESAKEKTLKYALQESAATYHTDSKHFDWHTAVWHLRVPMIRALFEQIATPARLGPLGLEEVLDWAAAALNRVEADAFFTAFDEGHAVQYFYEPFLQEFDPELRKELGVWYTPTEIVEYQVERVDTVLREELHIADGLADSRVIVLDPCCGTGAYVRAVLNRIAKTLNAKGDDGLTAQDLKTAAIERIFGFEILPAPFVIAHLQIGLLLENLGAPLNESTDERVGVYLTNSLTGWEPPKEKPKQTIMFPELEVERDAANRVKQGKKIIVVLGNPPYNGFAGVSPEEENDLVKPYKEGLISKWGIKKFNLDDLYVRFFRLAEKRIAEHSGMGVVSFISNHSWVSDPSFVVMRRHLLDSFDRFWIENMHGNRKISEYAPDGRTSETIFATPGFSVGIQQGVAISLWVKHAKRKTEPIVRFRNDIDAARATERRAHLTASLASNNFDAQYETVAPMVENRWSFRPSKVSSSYAAWPQLDDLCKRPPTLGILDNRQEALIAIDKDELIARVAKYLDPKTDWVELSSVIPKLVRDYARFNARKARDKLIETEPINIGNVRRVQMRPMDNRWCYYTTVRPIWTETRPTYVPQCWQGNVALVSRRKGSADPEGPPFFFTSILGMQHAMHTDAYYIPLRLKFGVGHNDEKRRSGEPLLPGIETEAATITANLSLAARAYLAALDFPDPDEDTETAEMIWMHALAIGYAPAYLTENADGIRQDWPRIPLPATKDAVLASATLGRQVAALLDTETPVPGVTCGAVHGDLKAVAACVRTDGKPINADAGDLDLTAGWGHAGKEGVTMPGRGKVETVGDALDIYLNSLTCWRNVPRPVWEYTIGGYQVIKKWLSYREKPLLGRGLTVAEVRYVTETARRIAALLALQPQLDENYRTAIIEPFKS